MEANILREIHWLSNIQSSSDKTRRRSNNCGASKLKNRCKFSNLNRLSGKSCRRWRICGSIKRKSGRFASRSTSARKQKHGRSIRSEQVNVCLPNCRNLLMLLRNRPATVPLGTKTNSSNIRIIPANKTQSFKHRARRCRNRPSKSTITNIILTRNNSKTNSSQRQWHTTNHSILILQILIYW